MSLEEQMQLDSQYVMSTFARKPVEFVSGDGMYLFDDEGKRYTDFLSGIGVVSLGHCSPVLVSAINSQIDKLIHVSNYFYIENRGEVAKRLSELVLSDGVFASLDSTDEALDVAADASADQSNSSALSQAAQSQPWKSFFANSGAEANECAIKLARRYAQIQWEKENPGSSAAENAPELILTLDGSFHGRTLATLAATAQERLQAGFEPLPSGFISTPINDMVELKEIFAKNKGKICAVMLECIQGEHGVYPCTNAYLKEVNRLCKETGALVIIDEVQTGLFRTGKPFAFQHFEIEPDIITVAKGIASGIPAAACVASSKVAKAFHPGDHGSTFGGSNVAMAAARATLEALSAKGFAEHVRETGAYFKEQLNSLTNVKEVRGMGLMVALEVTDQAPSAPELVEQALDKGFVLNSTSNTTLRFLPPLICEEQDIDKLVSTLKELGV